MNESGLWTAAPGTFSKCYSPRPEGREWIEVWSLLHQVKEVRHDNNTYTITVEPRGKGFQFVYIRRLNPSAVVRFVTPDLTARNWRRGMNPTRPADGTDVRPGRRNLLVKKWPPEIEHTPIFTITCLLQKRVNNPSDSSILFTVL